MQTQAMTLAQLQHEVPSAFATHAHDSRSSRYAYIPTSKVIEGMMAEGFMPFSAKQSLSRIEGRQNFTKHMIRFRRSLDITNTKVGDSVPEIVLVNAHDGSAAYKLLAGVFRLICSNGAIVSEGTVGSISIHHTGNIVERVVGASYQIIDDSARVMGQIDGWRRLMLTAGEQQAFAKAAHVVRFGDDEGNVTTPITAGQLLDVRRREDVKDDLWSTFNRVQENVIKGGLRGVQRDDEGRRVRRVRTRSVNGIDQDVKLNRALWTLAEELAKTKQS